MIFEMLALFASGLFAGAAAYVTFVEHPARVECGTSLAVTDFGPSYRRGAVMQASLAILGFIFAVAAWFQHQGGLVLSAGVLLLLIVPFTLTVILPTNKRLLDPTLDKTSGEAAELLARWSRLHAVRTAAGCLSFALLVSAHVR